MLQEQRQLAVALVLFLVVALVVLASQGTEPGSHRDGDTRLWSLRASEILHVAVDGPAGTWSLTRDGEAWMVSSEEGTYRAGAVPRRQVLDALEESAVGVLVPGDPNAEQGFDGTTVVVRTNEGRFEVQVGARAIAGRAYLADGDRVLAVYGGLHEAVRRPPQELWDTTILRGEGDSLRVGEWSAVKQATWAWTDGGEGSAGTWVQRWRDTRIESWAPMDCESVVLRWIDGGTEEVLDVCPGQVRLPDGREGRVGEQFAGLHTGW